MPALTNPRHERFAQELAKGKTADEAYVAAGYKPNRHNASRLKTNETITNRVAEIQERGAVRAEITIADLTQMLMEDRTGARSAEQFSAAISAVNAIAKLHGLDVNRVEHDGTITLGWEGDED